MYHGYFLFLWCGKIIKQLNMKTAGWILIVLGILMIIIKGFTVPVKKNIVDAGPIQIDKTENKWIGWPTYAGGLIAVIGVVVLISARKNR
jgi:hypothetical protein